MQFAIAKQHNDWRACSHFCGIAKASKVENIMYPGAYSNVVGVFHFLE